MTAHTLLVALIFNDFFAERIGFERIRKNTTAAANYTLPPAKDLTVRKTITDIHNIKTIRAAVPFILSERKRSEKMC